MRWWLVSVELGIFLKYQTPLVPCPATCSYNPRNRHQQGNDCAVQQVKEFVQGKPLISKPGSRPSQIHWGSLIRLSSLCPYPIQAQSRVRVNVPNGNKDTPVDHKWPLISGWEANWARQGLGRCWLNFPLKSQDRMNYMGNNVFMEFIRHACIFELEVRNILANHDLQKTIDKLT